MDSPFRGPVNHPPERGDLTGSPMVAQQFSRFPPTLESLQSASTASARSRMMPSPSPPLRRKGTPRSVQSSPKGLQQGVFPPSGSRTGASMSLSPPLFDPLLRQRSMVNAMADAESRTLPSRNITDETIDDAYVAFILYCNPNVPASADSSELRRIFRSPPRSDGKSFSVFTLWELIRKFDQKEVKTWIQLATELGVEPPSLEKGQSAQKVQQYAVRLKRWMRAMHVDAFFEYCLGHPHVYYTQLPTANGPASESRDGVPLEEDLALRALVPEWKPKRGRKRAEDRENDGARVAKRPQLDTSAAFLQNSELPPHAVNFPQSAIPFSAFPEDLDVTDPWGAASSFASEPTGDGQPGNPISGPEFPWRSTSPVGYPQSAIIPRGHQPADLMIASEPHSAVTPSSRDRSRTRRRHGPAVSSAWPSSHGSITGKVRGRPPIRASVPNGPFSSFPANPRRSTTPLGDNTSIRSSPVITAEKDSNSRPFPPPVQQTPDSSQRLNARPSGLQLRVPPHSGRPVRLATPPTLVVNGINEGTSRFRPNLSGVPSSIVQSNDPRDVAEVSAAPVVEHGRGQAAPLMSMENIIHAVSTRILRGKLSGRSTPLESEEAMALANATVSRLRSTYGDISVESLSILCASCLGISQQLGLSRATPGMVTTAVNARPFENGDFTLQNATKTLCEITYTISFESDSAYGITSTVVFSNLTLPFERASRPLDSLSKPHNGLNDTAASYLISSDQELDDELLDATAPEATWKQRYVKLRKQVRKKELALREYKRNILQSVMTDI